MKKKLLASILTVCMLLTMLPTAALAAEAEAEPGTEQTAPVQEDAVTQPEEDTKGTEADPYSREDFFKMTRTEYIAAQKRLGGTMYVNIDDYTYEKDGVLGNGTADNSDKDETKLNYYGAPGAKSGKYSDEAVGKSVVFVGGTITSGVTGYKNIDQIGTSLLLAVPAYTDVTFQGTTFNNVMRFNYQLYTSPWSQLGELKFDDCTFNGIIVGATAAQTLTFDGCEFTDFTNTTDPNNSNPTWIRPAYGNWSAGDNEGQGDDFRSLTEINFINNTVTSTRPVKFEYISQWDMTSTVTATNNYFDISAQDGDTSTKNVGLYLGAHTDNDEFNLVAENNRKSEATAALYTIPANKTSLPAGSTVKDSKGNEITITDALEWKTENKVELKTEYQDSAVAGINGVGYDSLDAAITAAQNGDTITILKAAEDESGYKLNGSLTYSGKAITIKAASGVDVKFDMSTGVALHGAKITFEGVTFEYKTNNNYVGLQHTDTMVYNNCVFNGQMFLYGASETFNGCTFKQTSPNAYNVWTYGAKEVDFNDCIFECAGKSVLVYNEGTISGTDLTVTDTAFHASQPVEGKAAIEIDTSLMKGQTKISVDQATADKINGFGVGSNSGSSLWNDKKNNAQSENIAVTVAGEVVLEPQVIDFDTFIKRVEASEYAFDGTLANGKKLTVKWSPESGCLGNNCGQTHEGIEHNSAASNRNVPNKVNSSLAQFYLANNGESPKDVDVKLSNVNFVYEAKDFTLYGNTNWKGEYKADNVRSAQLYLMNSKNTLIESCTFDHVVFTSFNNSDGSTTIKNSEFKNIYNSYAIKDLVGKNGIEVSGCTFENCGGGIMIGHDSNNNDPVSQVTIQDNTFQNIDVAGEWTAEEKAGTRGMIQIAKGGDYTNASIILDGNTAVDCGPILRQLNQGIADNDVLKNNLTGDLTGLGGKLTYTSDSVKKTGENEPVQPTVYTVKFENADVAEMKVIEGTEITLPTPGNRPNYKFEGWYVGSTKVGSSYKVTGDVTFVAKWDYIDEDGGSSSDNERTYAIVTEDDGHGSVTVSADEASAGTRITVTVKPDAGYELDELTVTDAKNKDLKVTKRSETTYTFHMADSKVTVEASFAKDGTVQQPDTRFDDVAKSAWYYNAVEYVAENGIMSGVSAREFAPNAGFSRAMLAQTLYAMSGKPAVKAESTFADVAANAWYADAVNWAAEKGYVSGVGDGKFAPDASITREQMALILYRYAGSPDASGMVLREFADGDSVSAYAVDAIRWAVHEGLISGMENNTLAPQGTATRAQVAQILMNFHQKLDK